MNFDFETIFKRFFSDWQKFLMMGLGPLLINIAVGLVGAVLMFALAGPALFMAIRSDMMGIVPGPGSIFGMIGAFLSVFVVLIVLGVVAYGLANAGLVGMIAGYRRGEEVSLAAFWGYATRYFGKVILLTFVFALIMILSMVMLIIPILGWIAFMVWLPTASVILGIYPAHLVVNQGYGVGDAISVGFRILRSQFGPALMSGLVMLGFGLVMGAVSMVPLVGGIVIALFGQALVTYFFIEHFEARVRPTLQI